MIHPMKKINYESILKRNSQYILVMLMNELEELEDIYDTLVFEDPPSIFNEDYALEFIETALHLMDEYMIESPTAITEPDFHDTLLDEIKDIFYIQMEDASIALVDILASNNIFKK